MIKYRVQYIESESGWGSDVWTIDYDTEQEAVDAYQSCWNKHMEKDKTTSYYIRPTYFGAVEV